MNDVKRQYHVSTINRTRTNNVSTVRSASSSHIMTREKSSIIRKRNDFSGTATSTPLNKIEQQSTLRSNALRHKSGSNCSSNDDGCDQKHGFVNGNFSSGKLFDVKSTDKLYCMSYNTYADILVIGTASSLDFYDAFHYTLIVSVPQSSMVSSMVWISPPSKFYTNNRINGDTDDADCTTKLQLLAISDLNGKIALYCINVDILESQGPTLLYTGSNMNGTQIRSLDSSYFVNNDTGHIQLMIVVGDKSGTITIIAFDCTQRIYHPIYTNTKQIRLQYKKEQSMEYEMNQFGILGIAIEWDRGLLAVSTSGGLVQVFSLLYHLSSSKLETSQFNNNDDNNHNNNNGFVWSKQNTSGGAIRDIVFGNNTLTYGGYDKTIIIVDIAQWAISRELNVQGTVRYI
jgi:hypothetical protein